MCLILNLNTLNVNLLPILRPAEGELVHLSSVVHLVLAVLQHEKQKPELMFKIRIVAAVLTSFYLTIRCSIMMI